jgi:hypothetical protein
MSTFQPALNRGMGMGFIGTGNSSQEIAFVTTASPANFVAALWSKVPAVFRELMREPVTYAPYRESLVELIDVIQFVLDNADELEDGALTHLFTAANLAFELLLSRPSGVPRPHIDFRQNGKIEFEWYETPRKVVSFTIDHNRKIVFSALIGSESVGGTGLAAGKWPEEVVKLIKRVID